MGTARITFLLALGASLWGAASSAVEVDAPRPQAEASATVTVTAEALPVELVQTPNPVIVLDKAAIDGAGAANLGDLLKDQLPGQVFSNGGVGTAASIFMGGARAQDTVVTLDGLRLEDTATLGGVNPSVIGLAGIDRIEIQAGPCSTRYGSDALGGAVALYSGGGAARGFSGDVRAAAGNAGILRGTLGTAYGWDSGWVRGAFSAQREDQVLDPHHPYRSSGTYLGLGRQLGDDTLVTVNYYNTYSGVPIPIVGTSGSRSGNYDLDRQDFSRTQILDGTVRSQLTPVLSGDLTVGQVLQRRLEPNYTDSRPTDVYQSRRNQMVGHLVWQPSTRGSVMLGLDASEDQAKSPDANETSQITASAKHVAVLLEGQRELVSSLRVVGSLRSERDSQTVPGTDDHTITQTTGKLGVNWTLPRGFRVYASAGTGFSNPLLYQSLYNAQYQGGALSNEKSRTAQAGLSYAGGPWTASLEVSRTLYSDLVYYNDSIGIYYPNYGGYYSGLYQNASELRIQSAELKAGYATKVWGLSGFYRNQEARDFSVPASQQLSSSAVVKRPFQTLGASAFRVLGDFRLDGRWSWIGPRYMYGLAGGFHQHYNDLSLAAAWAARKDLSFTLRGDNLMQPKTSLAQWVAGTRDFQNDAAQVYGYPAQAPTVTAEVRYLF